MQKLFAILIVVCLSMLAAAFAGVKYDFSIINASPDDTYYLTVNGNKVPGSDTAHGATSNFSANFVPGKDILNAVSLSGAKCGPATPSAGALKLKCEGTKSSGCFCWFIG